MKKYASYILIVIALVGLFSPVFGIHASTSNPNELCRYDDGGDINDPSTAVNKPCKNASTTTYQLLAPLGTQEDTIDLSETNALGTYLNAMIQIFIGICAVLAVVMIIIGGLEYMTSELPGNKEHGKERIRGAVFGLILALGAYALLFTVNPDLLNTDFVIPGATVTVTLDQANFAVTEKTATAVGTKYALGASTSPGVSDFARTNGTSLNNITVDTAAKRATFCAGTNCVSVPINIGFKGIATAGQAKSGDSKTPIGTTTIGGDRRIGSNGNAVISQNGYNLGAAFINIGATINGSDRGIGFHGSYNDNLGTTNGCIRMSNQDLIALAPYMKAGIKVTIK